MAEASLRNKTKNGLIWSTFERFSTQGVQFVFSIILARLLSPSDYGIIAMPMIFLSIAQVFIDSGFANALIRKPDLTEKDLSTAFYFNLGIGFICYLLLFATSPLIADFYDTPILSSVLKATALSTLFNPLCSVQQALLTIKMNFRIQARVSLLSAIAGGILGVFFAYEGYGVWALVISQIVSSFLRVVLLWIFGKWHPTAHWSKESFQYLWGFGNKLLLSGLINTVYQNIYPLIIGKYYTSAQLGYYTRAHQFANLPSANYTGVIRRVTFPALSSIQNDDEKLSATFHRILRVSFYLICPLMFALIGISDHLIVVLLSEKWLPASDMLKILSLAMVWYPIDALNLNLLTVKGRSDLFLKLEVIKKIFAFALVAVAIRFGITAICLTLVIYAFFEIITDTYYTGKYYGIGFFKQMKDLLPSLVLSCVMLLTIEIINYFIINHYVALAVGLFAGALVYVGISYILKMKELKEFWSFVLKK